MKTPYGKIAEGGSKPDTQWYRTRNYDPPFLHILDEQDHEVMIRWSQQTDNDWPNAGASGVEMMTMLTGLIMATGISRVVQCGHYVGFSTLIIGFICRKMGLDRFLYTVDLDFDSTEYTKVWIEEAGLTKDVFVALKDSSDPSNVIEAIDHLGGAPQLVYIDSSHQYEHTLRELRLWWGSLAPGGFIVMDDISRLAADFDSTGLGGSHRAALEFCSTVAANSILINAELGSNPINELIYTDVCGFGLIQKPF